MTLLEALKGTYSVLGQEMTDVGLEVLAEDLVSYPLPDVQVALTRCRKELRRMTLADILDRLPGGHPGPEEAWALVVAALGNEAVTIVWTDPMRVAFGVARVLADDPVAARMAFKEAYQREAALQRAAGRLPQWTPSLGHEARGREAALEAAVQQGRITAATALHGLPWDVDTETRRRIEALVPRLLDGPNTEGGAS